MLKILLESLLLEIAENGLNAEAELYISGVPKLGSKLIPSKLEKSKLFLFERFL